MKTVHLSMTKAVVGILSIAFVLTSCNQAKKADNVSNEQDSVKAEQNLAEERAKAEALVKDSVEYTHFTSPDLSTFFLHGRVKTMTETENGMKRTFHFSPEGKLVKYVGYDDEPAGNKIIRAKNRITGLGELQYAMMTVSEFEYDSNGICKACSDITGHGYTKYSYTSYDENGWPVSARLEGGFMHMGQETESSGNVSYTYTAKDENGNWAKRVESGKVKSAGISMEYDPDTEEEIEREINETEKISATVNRTITYYTREELGL